MNILKKAIVNSYEQVDFLKREILFIVCDFII